MKKPDIRPYLHQFYRNNHLPFLGAAFHSVLGGALSLVLAWLIKELTDTISGTENALPLSTLLLAMTGLLGMLFALEFINYHSTPRFLERAMLQYKNFIFEKLSRKNITSFQDEATAAYISALSNDANNIEANYLSNQFALISSVITFCGAFIMMFLYSPLLTLIAVAVSLLPVAASMLTGTRLEQAERQVSDKNAHFIATLTDVLNGFSVIKSCKAENAVKNLFQQSNQTAEASKCRKRKIGCILSTIGSAAGIIAQFGVFIAGAYLALAGKGITAGVVIAFVQLMNYVISPIGQVPGILANQRACRALIEKLAGLLDSNVRDEGESIPHQLADRIEVQDLTFCYDGQTPVLNNLNIRFEAGKSYALVGASGSGKSTLLQLLMAAHDGYQGNICIDGTPLRQISCESLYELISMIQQNVFVFNASIRDNITMFQDFPEQEIDRAIRLSGLHRLTETRGMDYLCGENGSNLSGGEKQRISIARSLLRKSSVLLVDEATAALDAETAYQVSNAILDLDGLTRIVVTHALDENLLRRYDGILVLKSGTLLEQGSFDELMAKKQYFYSLYTVSQ